MPVLPCYYQAPPGFRNGHIQSIYPTLFRRDILLDQKPVRINGLNGDFLDLDVAYARAGSRSGRAVIVSHGLEGNSRRKYIKGICRIFNNAGVDAIAWNQPGCGPHAGCLPRVYHMGETRDLACVVGYALEQGYESLGLVGFSMGGNQILCYLGQAEGAAPQEIKAAAVFSVPCHLPSAVKVLNRRGNRVYMRYFMRTLHPKIRQMHRRFPGLLSVEGLSRVQTFPEFDNRFTAPLNGFATADDYYARASSVHLLPGLTLPTLLVNAADDPFLSEECYPVAAAEENSKLYFKVPDSGGHVGFVTFNRRNCYWTEQAAHDFIMKYL